ncbi:MAG: hypothetical protein Greene041619_346 [Candidatus Peregrinibacteria bacterium Greene0416_19]|nr:MAG: hypothetical protein Greene041619_346 [Candidatus Peregrinibacteria bacterium Greene0416_19]
MATGESESMFSRKGQDQLHADMRAATIRNTALSYFLERVSREVHAWKRSRDIDRVRAAIDTLLRHAIHPDDPNNAETLPIWDLAADFAYFTEHDDWQDYHQYATSKVIYRICEQYIHRDDLSPALRKDPRHRTAARYQSTRNARRDIPYHEPLYGRIAPLSQAPSPVEIEKMRLAATVDLFRSVEFVFSRTLTAIRSLLVEGVKEGARLTTVIEQARSRLRHITFVSRKEEEMDVSTPLLLGSMYSEEWRKGDSMPTVDELWHLRGFDDLETMLRDPEGRLVESFQAVKMYFLNGGKDYKKLKKKDEPAPEYYYEDPTIRQRL